MKGIGKGKEFRLAEQFQDDTRLVKELRGVEEQIARELGQWQERIEVEDTSLAEIMAKARQRKPEPAQEPVYRACGSQVFGTVAHEVAIQRLRAYAAFPLGKIPLGVAEGSGKMGGAAWQCWQWEKLLPALAPLPFSNETDCPVHRALFGVQGSLDGVPVAIAEPLRKHSHCGLFDHEIENVVELLAQIGDCG
jgi:hypothetical protein